MASSRCFCVSCCHPQGSAFAFAVAVAFVSLVVIPQGSAFAFAVALLSLLLSSRRGSAFAFAFAFAVAFVSLVVIPQGSAFAVAVAVAVVVVRF
jgi:hypothetical protein